jgi:hypothetical protein
VKPSQPHVAELYIYPLKGAGGTRLDAMEVDAFGPRHDRRWLAVDRDGRFVSQRELHRLALVRPRLDGAALVLHAEGSAPLAVQPPAHGARRRVRIWADEADARDAGDEAAAWLSDVLGEPLRLVWMPDDAVRPVHPAYGSAGDRVSFADAFPFLITSRAALDLLNRRLGADLRMNRFRPNIVVDGVPPHAEDTWRTVRIGAIPFDVVKPCARCVVTTVDQESAITGLEPLRELARYRKHGSHVLFGQNAIHRARGWIRAGDVIDVDARRKPAG